MSDRGKDAASNWHVFEKIQKEYRWSVTFTFGTDTEIPDRYFIEANKKRLKGRCGTDFIGWCEGYGIKIDENLTKEMKDDLQLQLIKTLGRPCGSCGKFGHVAYDHGGWNPDYDPAA